MKRRITSIVASASFVAGCCLMQGCVGQKQNTNTGGANLWNELPEEPVVEVKQDMPVIAPVKTTTAYSVQKGDTISGIAVRHGLRWQDVVAVNPGISPNKLQVGQVIQLPGQVNLSRPPPVVAPRPVAPAPSRAETVYVVKNGDTLSGIALKHDVKVSAIMEANGLKDANKISVNQKLKIPGGVKSTATVAPKPPVTPPKPTAPKPADVVKTDVAPVAPPPLKVVEDTVVKPVDPAPEAAVTPVAPTAGKTHTVKAGEDLYTVAVRWGVSPSDLKARNKLSSPDLQEGQVLIIPETTSAQ